MGSAGGRGEHTDADNRHAPHTRTHAHAHNIRQTTGDRQQAPKESYIRVLLAQAIKFGL